VTDIELTDISIFVSLLQPLYFPCTSEVNVFYLSVDYNNFYLLNISITNVS